MPGGYVGGWGLEAHVLYTPVATVRPVDVGFKYLHNVSVVYGLYLTGD